MRIGQGYDAHRLAAGKKLVLGGIEIPYEKGLLGHSDADVLVHAVMDARAAVGESAVAVGCGGRGGVTPSAVRPRNAGQCGRPAGAQGPDRTGVARIGIVFSLGRMLTDSRLALERTGVGDFFLRSRCRTAGKCWR